MQKDFIENMRKEFEQGFLENIFTIGGHKWTMRTLNGLESLWRDRYVDFSVSASFLSSRKVPTLAVAIKAIDGKPIAEVFGELPAVKQEGAMIPTPLNLRGNDFDNVHFKAAEELRTFLESSIPSTIVDDLFKAFSDLEMKSLQTLEKVVKLEEEKKEVPVPDAQPFPKPASKR